jgi:dTDP-4-dehydrorhamnose 3,5-epimerase
MKLAGAQVVDETAHPQGTRVFTLDIPGLRVIAPRIFGDARGFFLETYNATRYAALGIREAFVQDNLSRSCAGVLRGLHFQNPQAQAKLVSVMEGEVFDVAVDIRRDSPSFGRWAGIVLDAESRLQFLVPRGFAHGFCVLSGSAVFSYKCDDLYQPQHEHVIRWDDPDIGISWPVATPMLSDKDAAGIRLRDFPRERLPEAEA